MQVFFLLYKSGKIFRTSFFGGVGIVFSRSEFPFWFIVHGPGKFCLESGLEYLFDGHLFLLAPTDRDSRIHIVDAGGAKGHWFVIFPILRLQFILLHRFLQL